MRESITRILSAVAFGLLAGSAALAQCPASVPAQGAALRGALPLFPPTNWWNLDISTAPVDPASASYVSFINNGGTRRLHPDFGGEVSPGSVDIYGMPYAVVDGAQPKQAVTFDYWDESDGVNYSTGQGIPFYPLPTQATTQAHWIEGGAPGNVDQRSSADRHLLVIDCTNKYLYELYNVYYNPTQGQWYAGSGAFFDMNANNRRPDTWTSADAAGLAIFPGLVRYDEAWDPAVADIGHALRVTVRATNGYVYPASHRAGSTAGALPMGARLRLKTNVGGADPALRTSDPNARKIFRAMQKYGLLVADNGSDMYISGTFDTRWNNDILNPAFATLTASDFEVIQLGWNPPSGAPALSSVSASPNAVVGGNPSTGTVTLTAPAPAGGALVGLTSSIAAATVPASVTIGQGASSAAFAIATSAVTGTTVGTFTASYASVNKTTTFTVNPALPTCTNVSPTVAVTPSAPAGVPPGTLVSYNISVTNRDVSPCTASTFNLAASAPTGWTLGWGATSLSIAPGASASTTLSITSPATAANGSYTISGSATNTAAAPASAPFSAAYAVSGSGGGGTGTFSDNFERTNDTNLGFPWSEVSGDLVVNGNALKNAFGVASHKAVVSSLSGATQTVSADFMSPNNNQGPVFGLILRYQNPTNYYTAYRQVGGSAVLRIARVVNGTTTILKSLGQGNPAVNVPFKLTARVTGAALSLDLNGVNKLNVNDATFPSGKVGVLINSSSKTVQYQADNFTASVQ